MFNEGTCAVCGRHVSAVAPMQPAERCASCSEIVSLRAKLAEAEDAHGKDLREIANELGCEADNVRILETIDTLKRGGVDLIAARHYANVKPNETTAQALRRFYAHVSDYERVWKRAEAAEARVAALEAFVARVEDTPDAARSWEVVRGQARALLAPAAEAPRHPEPEQPRQPQGEVPTISCGARRPPCFCGGDDDDGHTAMPGCPGMPKPEAPKCATCERGEVPFGNASGGGPVGWKPCPECRPGGGA